MNEEPLIATSFIWFIMLYVLAEYVNKKNKLKKKNEKHLKGEIMKISVVDGSNYFKGLLLLIRKDHKIAESEIHLMKRIGKTLGFEREFCDTAIHDILENEYIIDELPEFSTKELATKFIKDGLAIAFSDNEIHASEQEWLRSTAEKNGIDLTWFQGECRNIVNRISRPFSLEVDDVTVQYS